MSIYGGVHAVFQRGNDALGKHMCRTYRAGWSVYHPPLSVRLYVLLTSCMQNHLHYAMTTQSLNERKHYPLRTEDVLQRTRSRRTFTTSVVL